MLNDCFQEPDDAKGLGWLSFSLQFTHLEQSSHGLYCENNDILKLDSSLRVCNSRYDKKMVPDNLASVICGVASCN